MVVLAPTSVSPSVMVHSSWLVWLLRHVRRSIEGHDLPVLLVSLSGACYWALPVQFPTPEGRNHLGCEVLVPLKLVSVLRDRGWPALS